MGLFKRKKSLLNINDDVVYDGHINFNNIIDVYRNYTDNVQEKIEELVGDKDVSRYIYWFFPTVLFRMMFPQITYLPKNKYTIFSIKDNSKREYVFTDNAIYLDCRQFLKKAFSELDEETRFKIISHGGDWDVVSQILEKGGKLRGTYLMTMYILHEDS